MRGRVLVVAGSDSGGGAGIQADIKAITALGAFAATAITAVTAQNTVGVQGVVALPPDFIRLQMASVLDDLGADVVKIGMLGEAESVHAVADELDGRPRLPLVLDPVMTAKGGAALLAGGAVDVLIARLLPRTALLTPNVPEAEALTGMAIADEDAMVRAGEALRGMGAAAVLLKGGHLGDDRPGPVVTDLLITADGVEAFSGARIETRHTHGTGCTLASAVAAGLAQGMALPAAVQRARNYVQAAIAAAPGFGAGHGPLDHAVTVDPSRLG
jgi:hydroxymethylpyrimidine/phosphomethylpyrimidine kinase